MLFVDALMHEIKNALPREYDDNFDQERFGDDPGKMTKLEIPSVFEFSKLQRTYEILQDENSKRLLVKIMAYWILGYRHVKLPINTQEYWTQRRKITGASNKQEFLNISFMNWKLPMFDLNKEGIPVKLYCTPLGVLHTFYLEQYKIPLLENGYKIQEGDVVIDAGGCWGDTALYFAGLVGKSGRVFSFEFVPSNLEVISANLNLNPCLQERIEIVEKPLWCKSNLEMHCLDNGPGSKIDFSPFPYADFKAHTVSIDDFVDERKVTKVDFIKMDIEGAELSALKGAESTLKKWRPKLAISLYHSIDDFVEIPKWLDSLGLNYSYCLGHYTIHNEETVLFAFPR